MNFAISVEIRIHFQSRIWIGKNPNSLKLQKVPREKFEQTFYYGLKDITKLDDFNQLVDWGNSSFYLASNDFSISMN